MSMQTLYRYWENEALLYVGISEDPVRRMREHGKAARWWERATHATFERYETREEVLAAESAAILSEKPLYNIAGTSKPRTLTPRDDGMSRVRISLVTKDPLEMVYNMDEAVIFSRQNKTAMKSAIRSRALHAWRGVERDRWLMQGACIEAWVNGEACAHLDGLGAAA